jgi:hypothetical protein
VPRAAVKRDAQEHRVQFDLDAGGLGRHGSPGPRGQVARPGARDARFGRMFPYLPESDPGDRVIARLAEMMVNVAGGSTENLNLPAGYTYFGQFVDHDITFDPTSKLQRDNDPNALVDFRTPRLDLDSLYGSGPLDQPFLYDWHSRHKHRGVKLLIGRNPPGFATQDLPRNQDGRALIGDARNDENLIISQLHLLFIRFHNKVVDWLLAKQRDMGSTALFEEAQRTVRWHYQWIVIHDFLPRIVESTRAAPGTAQARPLVRREFFKWRDRPFMPVEFSAAAYRFGHSMVRPDYKLNDRQRQVPILNARHPGGPFLGGFRRLPADLKIQWRHFFPTSGPAPQNAMQIDPKLTAQLADLPTDHAVLISLNLRRGQALGLPAGPDVAHAIGETSLGRDELLTPLNSRIRKETREALMHATPLWYYVLCEALALGAGERLGPVGGRIVAEVLMGLLDGDPNSYARQWPRWTPELPAAAEGSFTMADLVKFTQVPLPG